MIESDRGVHQRADFRSAKGARATAFIEVAFKGQTTVAVVFKLEQGSPLLTEMGGKGVGQVEADELSEAGLVAVR